MVCLDTTFLIDVVKGKNFPKKFRDLFEDETDICVASPSIVELIKGIRLKKNLKYVTDEEIMKIEKILDSLIILDLEKKSAIIAGEIEANLRDRGENIGTIDSMIGAICLENNETLITRNVKHFERIKGLKFEGY